MKILIIGGTRFIGLATTNALHAAGHTIAVFNRGNNPLPEGIQQITGDVNALRDSAEALRAFAPDVVWHNIVLNEGHVRDVQAVFTGVARRFVMTSSMDVYLAFGRLLGKEAVEPITYEADENSPLRSVLYPYRSAEMAETDRMYHYDKIPAEKAALESAELPGTVVRLPMVIGANDGQRRLLPFIQPMQAGRTKIVLDEQHAHWKSTYGYVDNMARALHMAIESDAAAGRLYNAADGVFSWLEIGTMVKDALVWPGTFVLAPGADLPEALRFGAVEQDLAVRAERIRAELGYAPLVDFSEGLRRTVAWDLEHLPTEAYDANAQDEALAKLSS